LGPGGRALLRRRAAEGIDPIAALAEAAKASLRGRGAPAAVPMVLR